MKKSFFILFTVATVTTVSAQQKTISATPAPAHNHSHDDDHDHGAALKEVKPANPNAAKLTFKEESYSFGEIPEGPAVTHEFKFTNTGKEPLILSNVKASCGCTTPSWPKEPVLPGKDATIVATYNTQGRPGPFTKTITVTSNAETPEKVLTIKGEVVKEDPNKSVPMEAPSMLTPKN